MVSGGNRAALLLLYSTASAGAWRLLLINFRAGL